MEIVFIVDVDILHSPTFWIGKAAASSIDALTIYSNIVTNCSIRITLPGTIGTKDDIYYSTKRPKVPLDADIIIRFSETNDEIYMTLRDLIAYARTGRHLKALL